MTLAPTDLILSAGSMMSVPVLDRLRPARDAGFAGVSLMGADYQQMVASGVSAEDLRRRAADEGLVVTEVEGIYLGLPGREPGPTMPASLAQLLKGMDAPRYLAVAVAAGASSITVIDMFDGAVDIDQAAEAFANICDRARDLGLTVQLEYVVGGGIATYADTCEVIRRAGRGNGGLMIDSWHLFRGNVTLDELARTPGDRVFGVQINDGPPPTDADPLREMTKGRLMPGEGIFDLVGMIRTLDAIGSKAPISIEVFSDTLSALPADEAARRCAETTRATLHKARG